MSKGRTAKPRWLANTWDEGRAQRWWVARGAPWLTRAFWPRASVGLPSFPTISGKRAASRRARRQWLADLRDQRREAMVRDAGRIAMAQHRRMETATPEEQRRIFEEGL